MKYIKCTFSHSENVFTEGRIYKVNDMNIPYNNKGSLHGCSLSQTSSNFIESTEEEYNKQEGILQDNFYTITLEI